MFASLGHAMWSYLPLPSGTIYIAKHHQPNYSSNKTYLLRAVMLRGCEIIDFSLCAMPYMAIMDKPGSTYGGQSISFSINSQPLRSVFCDDTCTALRSLAPHCVWCSAGGAVQVSIFFDDQKRDSSPPSQSLWGFRMTLHG
jgi:hypothetical protein